MDDKNIVCQIKRSDRPCLICPGYMDLVQTSPPKFGLLSGLAFACSSEAIDCLDCQKCGFQTTTGDYQYLMMCKKDRLTKGTFIDKRMNSPSHRRTNELSRLTRIGPRRESRVIRSSSAASHGRNCSHCQASLESSAWQFCPKCGKQCPLQPTITTESLSSKRRESANENSAPVEIPTDIIIRNNSSSSSNSIQHNTKMDTESKSAEAGIARTVTSSTAQSANIDYLGPVEMQY